MLTQGGRPEDLAGDRRFPPEVPCVRGWMWGKKQEPWENHQKTMGKCVELIDILFVMVCEQGEPLVVWKQWGEKRVAFRSVCHGLQDPSGSKSFCMVPSH